MSPETIIFKNRTLMSKSTLNPGDVVDIHVHLGGPPDENNEMYYWSHKFTKSAAFEGIKMVTRLNALTVTGPRFISVLLQQLQKSKYVDKLVLLGLDEVYAEDGTRQPENTHLFVSNAYLEHLNRIYPQMLMGCSVHPYAPDAVARLWECAATGAVLCKWLPSSQAIDPTHPLSVQFYHALARLKMPLLLHVGPEGAIPPGGISQSKERLFNSAAGHYGPLPGDGIQMALEAGVKVIVAHAATPVGHLFDAETKFWEKEFHQLMQRVESIEDDVPLYADISAFCLPGRFQYVQQVIPLAKERPNRFCYGSDYPIPIMSFSDGPMLKNVLEAFGWFAGRTLPANDFDKNFKLLQPHFPASVFTNAVKILRHPRAEVLPRWRFLNWLGIREWGSRFFSFGRS